MTRDITPDITKIRLYQTEPHPCSYLDDKSAITAFVDPTHEVNSDTYNHLSLLGFRRSGQYVYTPRCGACQACISARVVAATFKPSRQQRRCAKRNADLEVTTTADIDLEEHYDLYQKYVDTRHSDGDMYPATLTQFKAFIGAAWECTRYLEFRLDGQLICCAVVDWLSSGASAIYTYFNPDFSSRSLGTYAIIKQIEITRDYGLDYVYLGYWIRDCDKMNYKSRFRPLQLYINHDWVNIS